MRRFDLRRAVWGLSIARVPPGVRPDWTIVFRGYDREQVDAFLDQLEGMTTRPLSVPEFRIAFRGYERHGVEEYVQSLLAQLAKPDDVGPSR